MRKIGIMGGTFNPIHVGHLMLAQWAMEEQHLDEIWFVPTGCSYMKEQQNVVSPEDRFQMVSLAVADNDRMKCLDLEIKREGHTYSYETIEQLKQEYPEIEFYFIFGADCLFAIETWRCPEKIFANCRVIAAGRGGASEKQMREKIEELEAKYGADIIMMPFPSLAISSTLIRERVREGKNVRYLVPEVVADYIEGKRLYENER